MKATCAALLVAVPTFIVMAGTAGAAPVFSITGNLTLNGVTQGVNGSEGTPTGDSRSDSVGITGAAVTGTFGVVANVGNQGSMSSVSASAPGASINGQANAISDVALDNIMFLAPGMAAGTPVNYSINFQVNGGITITSFGAGSAFAHVGLTYAATPGNGVDLGEVTATTIPGDSGASGIFLGGTHNVNATTPVQTGFVDHNIFAEFILATNASVTAGPSTTTQGQGSADSDFLNTFSFPTSGPVFNFFDANNGNPLTGVTADSSDGCIVNNQFLCGTAEAATPVPAALPLFATGIGGLGLLGWRRKRGRT